MRALFTAAATPAHYHIQLPIAQALREAGHAVAFATGPNVAPRIEAAGFDAFPVGPPDVWPRGTPPANPEGLVPWVWEELYAGPPAAERLAALRPLCERWRPDVIVRENAELAGCIAAEALGIPHAVVQNGNIAVVQHLRADRMRARLDAMRASQGLPPDPDFAMRYRYLLFLPVPRSFHDPALSLPPTAHFLRPLTADRTGEEGLPEWIEALPPRPTVYMTLGTVFNRRTDLFAAAIAALRNEPVNLIATVGHDQDPEQFGPQPETVHIARYIPQSLLLSRCAMMVNIAGMNSVRSAFLHGVPLVLVPLVAEHAYNAARCEALGMARVLDAGTVTPDAIREAVRAVLRDSGYRAHAERVRDEVAAMPGPEYAVALLERLARDKEPLIAG
jgi:MGT family glycosyltransferase